MSNRETALAVASALWAVALSAAVAGAEGTRVWHVAILAALALTATGAYARYRQLGDQDRR